MLEKYVRRKKNRTRTMRILENMKRPTVIVESLTDDQNKLIGDALKAWRYITGKFLTLFWWYTWPKLALKQVNQTIFLVISQPVGHHWPRPQPLYYSRWQWCWWQRYVGDLRMVTDLRCWWQNHYVGDFFRYVRDFSNVLNRSPAHFVSNIRHQHQCHQMILNESP